MNYPSLYKKGLSYIMASGLFLLYCATNTLIYTLLKFFHNSFSSLSTMHIMSYVNILSFMLLLPYLFFNFQAVKNNFSSHAKLSITVLSSMLKIYTITFISPRNAMIISFAMPIFVILFSFLLLGEYTKKHISQYLYLMLSFVGVIIFVGHDFTRYNFIYLLLVAHVILRALVNIVIKKLSNRYITLFYMTFFYAIFGVIILYNNFDIKFLFNRYVIIMTAMNIMCQIALIKSYEIADKISLLQNLDYSRIFFTFLWTYLLLGEEITPNQFFGLGIILISILLSSSWILKLKKKIFH